MIEVYLGGMIVSFFYELASRDFRVYDLVVCPLAWPAIIPFQIAVAVNERRIRRLEKRVQTIEWLT